MDELVVRRRAGLMAVVAVSALLVAAGYLWRFLVAPSPLVLLVAVVLAVIGAGHLVAWRTSGSPVAAADDVGLRLRLGSSWCGLPWSDIERVEVDAAGRLRDGHIAVAPRWPDAVAGGLPTGARRAAAVNRLIYGAPLVAAFGMSTTTSAPDVAAALEALAAGRTRIICVDEDVEPEPSVEITQPATDGAPDSPVGERSAGRSIARAVSALKSLSVRDPVRSARAGDGHPATVGALALASDGDQDQERTVELPELPHLRRRTDVDPADLISPARADEVIFETTDEPMGVGGWDEAGGQPDQRSHVPGSSGHGSARVTWGLPGQQLDVPTTDESTASGRPEHPADPLLLIGRQITVARQQLRLNVEEVAERTSIRPHVIEAIEADDFGPCGGDFYARGHLRTLGRVLGIDVTPLLATYDAAFAAAPVDPRAVFDAELRTGGSGAAKGSAGRPSWALLLGTVLVLLLVWGIARYVAADSPTSPPVTTPSQGGNAAGLGSPGAGEQPVEPNPTIRITMRGLGTASKVVVTDHTHRVLFSGMIHAGQAKELAGRAPLTVTAANAGAVSLAAPGHRPHLLGNPGQRVVTRVRAP